MDMKTLAVEAAREAGALLAARIGDAHSLEFKGDVDIVTEMDKRAEALIVERIRERFPDHSILTEEGEGRETGSAVKWIIDPLDGTTNYAHGFPFFCVSIGIEDSGEMVFGAVYDPSSDELFTAARGAGALLNGSPLRVSRIERVDRSLLATGFPYDIRTSEENNLDNFSRFSLAAQAVRRAGSAALDLCYVACGRFDGFWELKLRPWDTSAAALVVSEAGGRVTDFSGGGFSIYGTECLASNGLIHDEMIDLLGRRSP